MSYAFMLYTLKVGGCLAAFYLFLKLFLSRETFHTLNRVVVLSALVVASLLPFCVVTIRREVALPPMAVGESMTIPTEVIAQEAAFPWETLLGALFALGGMVMLVRVVWSMIVLSRLVAHAPKTQLDNGVTLVHADHPQAPFSWFGYVVVSERDLAENADAILAHETAHIRLRHSWDLVLFDLVGVVQWFNPALWLLRRDLKAIHEYEADRAVLRSGVNAREYQLLLIKKAAGERWYSVANSFNHSNLKNRITMMIQKRSSRWAAIKSLLFLPLVGVALGAFAETVYVVTEDKVTTKNETLQPADEGLLKLRFRDEKGAHLAGVVVVKRGTSEGVCSDQKGYAELRVKSGDILICSMVGRTTIKYSVGNLTADEVVLTMRLEEKKIDDIVVMGYSSQEEDLQQAKQELEQAKGDLEQAARDLERAKGAYENATSSAEKEAAPYFLIETPKPTANESEDTPFLAVEQMPQFEGGDIHAFRSWVQMRVQYPKELQQAGIAGRVVVSFAVEKSGSVGESTTIESPDKRLSELVESVVRQSPKWTPGKQRGVAQRVLFVIPIEFKTVNGTVAENANGVKAAQFEGDDYNHFTRWAQAQLQYPEKARKSGVEGEVFVTFVVKANGKLGDVDVIGKADKALAKEAVRVVKSSPRWTPAQKEGEAVAAKYGIKLHFGQELADKMPDAAR